MGTVPPFWYLAWGLGLGSQAAIFETMSAADMNLLIVGGYIAGRLIELAFHGLADCGLFSWRPFDAYFRLITGRRNPCLILLTVGWLAGRPDLGLYWVAVWTALSSLILLLRLTYALVLRVRNGRLQSWLRDSERAQRVHPRAYRTFSATQQAYRSASGGNA